MDPSIEMCLSSLSRTPDVLEATLSGRPDSWLDSRHGEDILSPREVVGHFVQGEEEDWIPRARMILVIGESQPFTPFDPYRYQELSNRTPVPEMLAKFRELRAQNIEALIALGLDEEMLERRGTHPRHGSVTLRNLVHTWAAHDLYHLGQIYKSFSMSFVGEIGPWQATLNLPHFN